MQRKRYKMKPKLYPIVYACRLFNIPRSVMLTGVNNGAIPTVMRYDTEGCRCRAKHYVTQADAEAFYKKFLDGAEEREEQEQVRSDTRRKYLKPCDVFDSAIRGKIEDRLEARRLAEYGVSIHDLA